MHPLTNVDPLLSIVIATYKRAPLLRMMLNSIFTQMTEDFSGIVEIVVIDNGLDDSTEQMMREQVSIHPELRYIRRPVSVPMEESLMSARLHGNGQYLWVLGDDDTLTPGCLAQIVAYLLKNEPEIVLVGMDIWANDMSHPIAALHKFIEKDETQFPSLMEAVRQLGWGVYFSYLGASIFKATPFRQVDYQHFAHSPHVFSFTLLEAYSHVPCSYLSIPAIRYRTSNQLPYSMSALHMVTTIFIECFDHAVQHGWGDWRIMLDMRDIIASDHKLLHHKVHTLAACMLSNIFDLLKSGATISNKHWELFDRGYGKYGDKKMLDLLSALKSFRGTQEEINMIDNLRGTIFITENMNKYRFPRNFVVAIA